MFPEQVALTITLTELLPKLEIENIFNDIFEYLKNNIPQNFYAA